MKVTVKKEEKEFEPIELNIVIESERELKSLWANMNYNDTNECNNQVKRYFGADNEYLPGVSKAVWKVLNDLCKELGYK